MICPYDKLIFHRQRKLAKVCGQAWGFISPYPLHQLKGCKKRLKHDLNLSLWTLNLQLSNLANFRYEFKDKRGTEIVHMPFGIPTKKKYKK